MTKAERTCHRCGLVFVSDKLDGLCPSCLLTNTLDLEGTSDEHAFWEEEKPTSLGRAFSHFDILDELGRGGMGTVYRGRDHVTGRIVALKILQAHHLDEPDLVKRFRAEVRAVTSLDHRNILPIHEVGEHDGIPFFSMKLASGGSLAQRLPEYLGKPSQCAILLAKIARGIQHAHEHGILHRDLKPGNILLDDDGEPYVCDFGLAKWIDDDRRLTITSAVLGTPHYIAPEQASGKKGLTIAADIYSLGAILYELLTGRPPFVGESVIDTLRQASECTPAKPSSIVNHTPRDLEIICLKALEREPQTRYKTALAFAQDLENWVSGRPIRARPVTAAEQLWRWARRNPLPATLGATLAVAITALAIGATIAAVNIDKARKRAVQAEKEATEQLYNALLAQARASRMTSQAGHRVEALEAIKKAAAIHPSIELRDEAIAALTLIDLKVVKTLSVREKLSQRMACDNAFRTVAVATDSGDINILNLNDGSLKKTIAGTQQSILSIIHSGTKYLATRCVDDAIYLYDYESGRKVAEFQNHRIPRKIEYIATDFSFSHDEKLISLSSPEGIEIREIETAREIARLKTIQPEQCAFAPDGKCLAFAIDPRLKDTKFRVWNFSENQTPTEIDASAPPTAFAWSSDNQYLAVGCADYSIQIFRKSDWQKIGTLQGHRQSIMKLAFNHANDMLASNSAEFGIRLWDLRTMTELVELPGYSSEFGIGFSSDDLTLYASKGPTICAMDVVGLKRVCTAFTPPSSDNEQIQRYSSVEFSPDSRLVAKASINSVQIFDAKKAKLITTIPLQKQTQTGLRFLADNQTLAVLSRRTGITLYHYVFSNDAFEITSVENHSQWLSYAFGSATYNYSPYICLNSDKETKGVVYDISTGKTLCTLNVRPEINDIALSPDSKWLIVTEQGFPATVYAFPSGQKVTELSDVRGGPVVFSPSCRWIGTPGSRSSLLWSAETWKPNSSIPQEIEDHTGDLTFTFDEKLLAARISDHQIALAAMPTGELLGSLEQQIIPNPFSRLRFSPDGAQLASHGMDNSLVLWNFNELRRELHNINLLW